MNNFGSEFRDRGSCCGPMSDSSTAVAAVIAVADSLHSCGKEWERAKRRAKERPKKELKGFQKEEREKTKLVLAFTSFNFC